MTYKSLYESIQSHELPINRNFVREKIIEVARVQKLTIVASGLDTNVCRGYFLHAQNTENPLVRQCGGYVVVFARSLNRCWQRLVITKEMMHLFDNEEAATDTGEKFEHALSELFEVSSPSPSLQTQSEFNCFWMALGILCPEHLRQKFMKDRKSGHLDDYSIALKLRIPERYVPRLFTARYQQEIERLLRN